MNLIYEHLLFFFDWVLLIVHLSYHRLLYVSISDLVVKKSPTKESERENFLRSQMIASFLIFLGFGFIFCNAYYYGSLLVQYFATAAAIVLFTINSVVFFRMQKKLRGSTE